MRFKGSFTALITPFKNGAVDEDAFRRFVNWQIEQGTHGELLELGGLYAQLVSSQMVGTGAASDAT